MLSTPRSIGSETMRSMSNTPRSLNAPTPRSQTPGSINLIGYARTASQSAASTTSRALEHTRPRNPLGPRSWLTPEQRAIMNERPRTPRGR